MKIALSSLISSLSVAFDYVEHYVVGVSLHHGQRIAYISVKMGEKFGIKDEELFYLAASAMLHDSALAEFLEDETDKYGVVRDESIMQSHCVKGEENMRLLPFYDKVENAVLYHHERADGNGAFGKTPSEIPLFARIIHFADNIDATFDIVNSNKDKFLKIKKYVLDETGKTFDVDCVNAFLKAFDENAIRIISDENISELLSKSIPFYVKDVSGKYLMEFSDIFAEIVDYKSHFTCNHSKGIAEKAYTVAKHIGYDNEKCEKLYFAGALHDIGKVTIDSDILEKPAKLEKEEFEKMQSHANKTYEFLSSVDGLEDVTQWASHHHEKLDGTGYPFGLKADEFGEEERLLCCLDIYQALTESRPYKSGMTHESAMVILNKAVLAGQLDEKIVKTIDDVFGGKTDGIGGVKEAWKCRYCGCVITDEPKDGFLCPQCGKTKDIFEKM